MRGINFTADGEVHVLESLVDRVVGNKKNDTTVVYLKSGASITVQFGKAFTWERLPCNETLWKMGAPFAVCTQPLNTEHSHDRDGENAVALLLARPLNPDDVLFAE